MRAFEPSASAKGTRDAGAAAEPRIEEINSMPAPFN
jgi:hypothetical protein